MMKSTESSKPHVGIIAAICTDSNAMPEECAIPAPNTFEFPENCGGDFRKLVEEHKTLFGIIPGKITLDCHYIPTKGPPIPVPP